MPPPPEPGSPPWQPLIDAGAELHRRNWVPATAGNLSVRSDDGAWVTASGVRKGSLSERDFLRVDLAGRVRETPGGGRPSAETSLHLAVYRSVPAAGAVLHVHTVAGALASRWTEPVEGGPDRLELPPLEIVKAFGIWETEPRVAVSVFDNHLDVPQIGREVEDHFRRQPPQVSGFLIRDHGLTAWGADVAGALTALEAFDFLFAWMVEARRTHTPLRA